MALQRGVFIVGCKRTPFGSFGGQLRDVGSVELGQRAIAAAIQSAKIKPDLIDNVVMGNIIQCSQRNGPNIGRDSAIQAGIPITTPCLTVNRLCGSGFQALINIAQDIALGDSEIGVAAGSECESQVPFMLRDIRFGVKFSKAPGIECGLKTDTADKFVNLPMGLTAENLATKYNISREECDKFALQSQQRWAAAYDAGKFKQEIVPVPIKVKGKEVLMDTDQHPRPGSTMEGLAKLPPVFKKDGVVTAGNASGVNDGAAALVVASEDAIKKHSLTPLARLVGYATCGVEPDIMGIGPVPAIRKLCQVTGITLDKADVIEVNEAFAAQFLSVQKELELDLTKTNLNGGAIALGHPLAASGARIMTNLTYELKRSNKRYAIGAACIGGGQGIALLIENSN